MERVNDTIEVEVVEEMEVKDGFFKKYAKKFGKGVLIGTATVVGTVVVTSIITAIFGGNDEDDVTLDEISDALDSLAKDSDLEVE